MKIENLSLKDKPIIMKIWKAQGDIFGIPYNSEIDGLIKKEQFICMKENNQIIAICAYKKNKNLIKICHLWVAKKYRKKHIAIKLIASIIEKNIDCDFYVTCKSGAENNTFYDKFKLKEPSIEHRLTIDIRKYYLDKNKIMESVK